MPATKASAPGVLTLTLSTLKCEKPREFHVMHARWKYRYAVGIATCAISIAGISAALVQRACANASPGNGVPSVSGSPQWVFTTPMTTTRYGHTATTLLDGKVLVAGGIGGKGGGEVHASSELYNPVSGRWEKTGAMTTPRAEGKAVLLPDGRVLVAGGSSLERFTVWSGTLTAYSPNAVASAEVYNAVRGTWSTVGSMSIGRANYMLTVLRDGRVLASGGRSASENGNLAEIFSSAELFNPEKNQWPTTASMSMARTCQTATLLPNGKVLVTGGRSSEAGSTVTASAELYDPGNGTWSKAASMLTARCGHTATLLTGGKVLVTGGYNDENADQDALIDELVKEKGSGFTAQDLTAALAKDTRPYLNSAELYDPATNQWLSTGHMGNARSGHAALLLSNGNVLVARGQDRNSLDLDSAEIYNPANATWGATGFMNGALKQGLGKECTLSLLPNEKVLAAGGDKGYVEARPGMRERLTLGIYSASDYDNDSPALDAAKLLAY